MAVLVSRATGNWLDATTWGLVDSTSYVNSESNTTALGTSYTTSPTFTPGAITLSGIAIKIAARVGITGTLSIALDQAGVDVAGTTVTINTADLPASVAVDLNGGWVFMKFASPVTLLAATAYGFKAKTSVSSTINLMAGPTSNWSRALVTTTNQAPAAGDDVIICGEYTGAGTSNSFTVTMNETATTDYGSNTTSLATPAIAVCSNGTLAYGIAASTNYNLKVSGNLIVYAGGTFTIGTVGAEIPRTSTATLTFDCVANIDFGITVRNLGTFKTAGLSRTSGKNVVSALLAADTPTSLFSSGTTPSVTNGTVIASQTVNSVDNDPFNVSKASGRFTDNAVAGLHYVSQSALSFVTNVTQVYSVWIARGTGTNNRYVRLLAANSISAPTNGFYADVDLQAGTIGTVTALGNGTATSAAITALGSGYICTIVGKVSTASITPNFAVMACNSLGGTSYTGDSTNNFIFLGFTGYTGSTLPTSITVDTDTGWLTGDIIAIAPTSRIQSECELRGLSSDAGASTINLSLGLAFTHHGTNPTQGHVILLTRNIKIRGATTSLQSFIEVKATSIVDCTWTEFMYLGSTTAQRRGIDVGTTTAGSFNMQYCSIHDNIVASSQGINFATGGGGYIFSNNVVFYVYDSLLVNAGTANTTWIIDNNILMRGLSSQQCATLADVGGTYTNNYHIAPGYAGLLLQEVGGVLGTFSNIVSYGGGFSFYVNGTIIGLINGMTAWRNNGIYDINGDFAINNLVMFGTINGLGTSQSSGRLVLYSPTFNGDTLYSTNSGISGSSGVEIVVYNGDFGTASGIKTAHTAADLSVQAGMYQKWTFINTKFSSTNLISGQSNMGANAVIQFQKFNQVAGSHKTLKRGGTIAIESTTTHIGTKSMKMTPISSTDKLETNCFIVAVASGATITPSVYIYKDATYNGNQPRLILKRNDAIGITSDTVIATYSASTGSWNAISGTTAAATDDGAMEFVIDCDGTAGNIYVDSFSVS